MRSKLTEAKWRVSYNVSGMRFVEFIEIMRKDIRIAISFSERRTGD